MIVIEQVAPFGSLGQMVTAEHLNRLIESQVQEAITKTLTDYRLRPFPTSPENPWRITAANFAKMVDKAVQYAGNVPSRQHVAAALVNRGYTTSDIDAYSVVTPPAAEIPPEPVHVSVPAPVIQLPQAPLPASVTRVSITMPPFQPPIPLPSPPPPAVTRVSITMPPFQPTIPLPSPPPEVFQPLTVIPAVPERPAEIQPPAVEPASDTKWMWALLVAAVLVKSPAA